MTTKYYVIEMLDPSLSFSAFYQEYQAESHADAMAQAKDEYPKSEMFNVYISTSNVSNLEGGNKDGL